MDRQELWVEEEIAAIQAAILMMWDRELPPDTFRVREVWPEPSPWRWAGRMMRK
ncbi:hypothetical protein [Sulfobacillus harzensis]|uniref:Uncharacterized protein n=1 Tax=Sulfobacillus harzensis TaxID=2729629 RepID=A0A7Y0L2Z5_9FIRM|nr:hypothetical protein [Sulfobacillus harzensis]NMP22347.1 hypothetical protein [Sulfobacillus harzensis]